MPATVNGIGTTYYGKKKFKSYRGRCEFCNRDAELQEYETTLWLVVAFIPLIPLGRKQILSYCSRCRKHRVLSLAQWERFKEESLGQHTAALAANPDDPATSIKLLHALAAFNRFEEAEKLAAGIQTRFDDQAAVQLEMGRWHDFRNRRDQADACYRAALKLEPQNVAAKRAVAWGNIVADQPDAALAALEAPPEITVAMDPGLYVDLGRAYQRLNQHHEALGIFRQVVEAAPRLAYDKTLRPLVATSEKMAGEASSMLPRIPLYRFKSVWIGATATVALAGILLSNYHISAHRTLHVLNGFGVPLEVRLDDESAMTLAPHASQGRTVSEGQHHATVLAAGKPIASDNFEISTGFFDRFLQNPVFVLNAGRGAAVLWEQATYSAAPGNLISRVQAGTPFVSYADVDYSFLPFPAKVKVKRGKSVTKSRVSILELPVEQIFYLPPGTVSLPDQLALAETHLAVEPDHKSLLQAYATAGISNQQMDRVRKFLDAGLEARPVRIEWHRLAQALHATDEESDRLQRHYVQWLQKEPDNSALWYLMGRMVPHREAMADFERAIAADGANPYPQYAKGFQLQMSGDLAGAKAAYLKAAGLRPADPDFRKALFDIRMALGEYAQLENDLSAEIKKSPLQFSLHMQLLEVLAARDKLVKAREANDRYMKQLTSLPDGGENARQAVEAAQMAMLYLGKEFSKLFAVVEKAELAGSAGQMHFQCHLEQNKFDAAASDLESHGGKPDPFDCLRLSIGWRMQGNTSKADEWQAKACAGFDKGLKQQRQVAALLQRAGDVSLEDTEDLTLDSRQRAAVLIALAQQSTAHRDELLALAEKLNYSRQFPYYFNERAIAAARKAP